MATGAFAAFGASSLLLRLDTDFDLTRLRASGARARGELIEVEGRVLDRDGTPQANARLEIWQANDVGRYAHPSSRRCTSR